MEVIASTEVSLPSSISGRTCQVFALIVKIKDIKAHAKSMIDLIEDTGWISKLGTVSQITYKARAARSIEHIVKNIFEKVEDALTKDFGEYLISICAQSTLETKFSHVKVPLAELWKEKIIGNPGFDFHMETDCEMIAFGESKYSGSDNPYSDALQQITKFIGQKKDDAELNDLASLVSSNSVQAYVGGRKCYVAAFSINGSDAAKIIENALKSKHMSPLLDHPKIFLVGVQVDV